MKKIIIILFLLIMCGCASNKKGYRDESAVEQRLMTMSKEEVLIDLGAPHKIVKIDDKQESWRYESEVGGLAGGECTLSILLNDKKIVQAKLSANDLSWVSFPLASCSKIIQTLR